ncbi:MAG: M20/M25/M40 family metallo-hydrolase [Chloroflexota bacterium]
MQSLLQLSNHPSVQTLKERIRSEMNELIDLIIQIQQIPAPTFEEAARAMFIQGKMAQIGLIDVSQDEIYNVYGRYPHSADDSLPPIIISAHSDTVFPKETDLTYQKRGSKLYGPGIGDNSTGVAGVLFLADLLTQEKIPVKNPIWFVSNVGEEGLGDLKGMRAVVERFGSRAKYIVIEGGLFGQISHQAIGVQRFKISVETDGGHSWGSFGKTSAIHELGRLITLIAELKVPSSPKTTFNVGMIEGGTSINTIAQRAYMLLDLRSEKTETLDKLVANVKGMVQKANRQSDHKTIFKMAQIGHRPAGSTPKSGPLVTQAIESLALVGRSRPIFITSSTDCNIPLSKGYESVCIGLTESNFAHRLDEHIDITHLPTGVQQMMYLLLAAANFSVS